MSAVPKELNSPLPIQICNQDGTLTPQGYAFLRRLWERTGYAPGTDSAWTAQEADIASIGAAAAQQAAASAIRQAQEALSEIMMLLVEIQGLRQLAIKALETAQDSAILTVTARGNAQAAQNQDGSMIFSIMNR